MLCFLVGYLATAPGCGWRVAGTNRVTAVAAGRSPYETLSSLKRKSST